MSDMSIKTKIAVNIPKER